MLFLLDTNIVLLYVRELITAIEFVKKTFNPFGESSLAAVSVVTVGELRAFSLKNNWGLRKNEKLEKFLSTVVIVDINSKDTINRYAEIDAFSQGRLPGKVSNFSARNMGKNDIWIAATASVLGATLLTTDSDFDHLEGEFLNVGKIDLNI